MQKLKENTEQGKLDRIPKHILSMIMDFCNQFIKKKKEKKGVEAMFIRTYWFRWETYVIYIKKIPNR